MKGHVSTIYLCWINVSLSSQIGFADAVQEIGFYHFILTISQFCGLSILSIQTQNPCRIISRSCIKIETKLKMSSEILPALD